jgi:predicted Holliday junction resolvase-like endonuclease
MVDLLVWFLCVLVLGISLFTQPIVLIVSSLLIATFAIHKLATDFKMDRIERINSRLKISDQLDETRAEIAELRAELREQLWKLREKYEEKMERRYQELVVKILEIENRISKLARSVSE